MKNTNNVTAIELSNIRSIGSNNLDINKFDFHIFNGNRPPLTYRNLNERAYEFWKTTWKKTYEIFTWNPDSLYSDQWSRQENVGVLSYENEIVGTMFLTEVNIGTQMGRDDSILRMWSPGALQTLLSCKPYNDTVLVFNWFTLNPEWRKSKLHNVDAKFILCAMGLKFWEMSRIDILCGCPITMSNVNKMCYEYGAHVVEKDVEESGVKVDLIYWDKNQHKIINYPRNSDIIESIWKNKFNNNRLPLNPAA